MKNFVRILPMIILCLSPLKVVAQDSAQNKPMGAPPQEHISSKLNDNGQLQDISSGAYLNIGEPWKVGTNRFGLPNIYLKGDNDVSLSVLFVTKMMKAKTPDLKSPCSETALIRKTKKGEAFKWCVTEMQEITRDNFSRSMQNVYGHYTKNGDTFLSVRISAPDKEAVTNYLHANSILILNLMESVEF